MGKNILIADDSQTFLVSLSLFLKKSGFGVIPAEDGMEVLKLVNLWEPGLIILDVNMAVMDGITVLRLLKENKKTAHIPVMMLSTDSSVKTMENCRGLGCYCYLHKPVKLHELHAWSRSVSLPRQGQTGGMCGLRFTRKSQSYIKTRRMTFLRKPSRPAGSM
jgi:two-component system, cell cycle response regulator DivK